MVGFTCGRLAGRLEASIAPAGFCGGTPLAPFAGTATTGFGAGFEPGFAATGFADGFAAGFATGFVAGFAAGFSAGLALPPISRESNPFFSTMCRHVTHEVGNAAAIAPLVVVPGHDLHELVAHHHGAKGVDD